MRSPPSSPAPSRRITLVKVFSATTARARAMMGDQITLWLARHPSLAVVETVVTASSDRAFHCLSIVLLCDAGGAAG
jgi:hypothetical protein